MQAITLQENYMGVAYVNLRLSRRVLLTYLLTYTYLINLSQHYDAAVDVMCNSSFAYFRSCCNSSTRACKIVAAFILFYFIENVRTCAINAAIYFIASETTALQYLRAYLLIYIGYIDSSATCI